MDPGAASDDPARMRRWTHDPGTATPTGEVRSITARWLTPGGPLHDPEAEGLDHAEPLTLVDPVPPELSGWTAEQAIGPEGRRRRWLVLAFLLLMVVAILVGGLLPGLG